MTMTSEVWTRVLKGYTVVWFPQTKQDGIWRMQELWESSYFDWGEGKISIVHAHTLKRVWYFWDIPPACVISRYFFMDCRPVASMEWGLVSSKGMKSIQYRGCIVAEKLRKARKIFWDHHIQRVLITITTSWFALHWHCFLLPCTIQHWVFFWSLPWLAATALHV